MKLMRNIPTLTFLIFVLLLSACVAPAAQTLTLSATLVPTLPASLSPTLPPTLAPTLPATLAPTLPASPAPTLPTTSAAASGLNVDILKNLTFTGPVYGKTFKLLLGKYEAGSGADYLRADLLDPIAFGDLNGDGKPDAAVLLAENGGGTGVFVSLITLLDQNGAPLQNGSVLVDDRPKINSIKIQDGKIVLDAVIHGGQDAMCCPSLPVTETYALSKSGLVLRKLESITPNGMQRAITITNPKDGDIVSGSVPLQGSVTIAPFENNLVYRIIDQQGNKLAEGPVMVKADGLGGPGTFNTTIDLSKIPPGLLVRLELVDQSAADGSTLAMDSVELMIK